MMLHALEKIKMRETEAANLEKSIKEGSSESDTGPETPGGEKVTAARLESPGPCLCWEEQCWTAGCGGPGPRPGKGCRCQWITQEGPGGLVPGGAGMKGSRALRAFWRECQHDSPADWEWSVKQYNDSKFCGPSKYRMQAPHRGRGKVRGSWGRQSDGCPAADGLTTEPRRPTALLQKQVRVEFLVISNVKHSNLF